MRTTAIGRNFIKDWEKCRLTAYLDRRNKGKWTIGWGHTGPEVHEGLVWTQAQADDAFERDLMRSENYIIALVIVPLTQNQFDALVSFIYNIGYTQFYNSTLRRLLNAGEYKQAAAQFARWKYDDGEVLQGLVRRRAAEEKMFSQGAPSWNPISNQPAKPSSVPPPTPSSNWLSRLLEFIRSVFSSSR
jgi:lysozyme